MCSVRAGRDTDIEHTIIRCMASILDIFAEKDARRWSYEKIIVLGTSRHETATRDTTAERRHCIQHIDHRPSWFARSFVQRQLSMWHNDGRRIWLRDGDATCPNGVRVPCTE